MPSYRAYLDSFKNLTTSPPAAPPSFGNFFETTEGFAASDAFDDEQSVATCYIFIFVWGMINVAAPVWKPETPSQTACMCVVVVFSVANNAAIFGSVVNAIVNITAYRNEERLRRKAIEKWCHDNSIPRALLKRIHAYYDSVGGVQHRAEDKLPPAMPRGIVFQLELYERRRLLLELRPQLTQEEVVDLVPKVSAHGRRRAARKWAARAKGGACVRGRRGACARARRGPRAVEETAHATVTISRAERDVALACACVAYARTSCCTLALCHTRDPLPSLRSCRATLAPFLTACSALPWIAAATRRGRSRQR